MKKTRSKKSRDTDPLNNLTFNTAFLKLYNLANY